MSVETRDALLYSQLQEGLKDELMKAPAVSGASTYKELHIAAKNEEKRLSGLKRCEQYHSEGTYTSFRITPVESGPRTQPTRGNRSSQGTGSSCCYLCNKEGNVAKDCRAESITKCLKITGRNREWMCGKLEWRTLGAIHTV